MTRRVARMIASAFSAALIAFGTAIGSAFANGATHLTEQGWWLIGGAIALAVGQNISASLSEPPRREGEY